MTLYELDLLTVAHRRKRRGETVPMAVLIQLMANVNRDSEQRFQPFELSEVLSWIGYPPEPDTLQPAPPPAPPTPDELRERLRLMAQLYPPDHGQPEGMG